MEQHHYRQAEAALAKAAAAVQQDEDVDLSELAPLASAIIDALHASDQLVVEALSSPPGSPLITNLINVGILATKVGMGLGYYGTELERLALAGLVHDIGIFAVPRQVLTKTGRLTAEERGLVEQHPRMGHDVIQRLGAEHDHEQGAGHEGQQRVAPMSGEGAGIPSSLEGTRDQRIGPNYRRGGHLRCAGQPASVSSTLAAARGRA
ncbi:MAG: hypothetical protein MRJ92_14170 [Nitrospira sp.]|nr:hypothetical protein [Nitrospira sp.]